MKLFVLERKTRIGYDESDKFVVRAEDEISARNLAAKNAGAEGPAEWLENWKSTCDELSSEGSPGIIVNSFNAG